MWSFYLTYQIRKTYLTNYDNFMEVHLGIPLYLITYHKTFCNAIGYQP